MLSVSFLIELSMSISLSSFFRAYYPNIAFISAYAILPSSPWDISYTILVRSETLALRASAVLSSCLDALVVSSAFKSLISLLCRLMKSLKAWKVSLTISSWLRHSEPLYHIGRSTLRSSSMMDVEKGSISIDYYCLGFALVLAAKPVLLMIWIITKYI